MASLYADFGNNHYHGRLDYSEGTVDQGNNRSYVYFSLYMYADSGYSFFGYTNTGHINLGGSDIAVGASSATINSTPRLLTSWEGWITHNSDGTITIRPGFHIYSDFLAEAWASTSWNLTNIPRMATITGTTGNINDESTTQSISYNNPGGFSVNAWFELPDLTGTTPYNARNPYGSGVNFALTSTEWNLIRTAMANVQSTTIKYVIHSSISGTDYYATSNATLTIINANPTFSTITYKDNNSTTTTITGNNQYLIQGNSILEVDIASGDKALAIKSATMTKYNFAVSSYSTDLAYTTSAIAQTIGAIANATSQLLTVKAIDSRGNLTAVTATVNILPYLAPQVVATGIRQNNFENTTTIHVEGLISLLTISGTNKNAVNTTSGLQYRYVEHGNSFTGVSWVNITNATNSTTGAVTMTDFTLNLDNTKSYDFQVQIIDKLNTVAYAFTVSVGIPIFRIGSADGKIYNNEVQVMPMIDEDSFTSNLDTRVPTQQSTKAYVDGKTFAPYADYGTASTTNSGEFTLATFKTLDITALPVGAKIYVWCNAGGYFSDGSTYLFHTRILYNSVGYGEAQGNRGAYYAQSTSAGVITKVTGQNSILFQNAANTTGGATWLAFRIA